MDNQNLIDELDDFLYGQNRVADMFMSEIDHYIKSMNEMAFFIRQSFISIDQSAQEEEICRLIININPPPIRKPSELKASDEEKKKILSLETFELDMVYSNQFNDVWDKICLYYAITVKFSYGIFHGLMHGQNLANFQEDIYLRFASELIPGIGTFVSKRHPFAKKRILTVLGYLFLG